MVEVADMSDYYCMKDSLKKKINNFICSVQSIILHLITKVMIYKQYLSQFQNTQEVENWLNNIKDIDKKDQDVVEHIIDYFMNIENPNYSLSYKEAKKKSNDWVRSMRVDTTNEVEWVDYEVVYTFDDWFRFVKLLSKIAYNNESSNMRHCIKTYFWKENIVYSLRDEKNLPHATMDIVRDWDNQIQQIQGKWNNTVEWKYQEYNIEFLDYMWFEINDRFMEKLWYISIKWIEKYVIWNIFRWYVKKDQSSFNVKICNWIEDITEDTVICLWDLSLKWYWFPLPKWFVHCVWYLYLNWYEFALPKWFTCCGWGLDLNWYEFALPKWFTCCGWYLYLRWYGFPLPEWFTHCWWYLDLRWYEFPLPELFTGCWWGLNLDWYGFPLPEWFTHCLWCLSLEWYKFPLPKWLACCWWYLYLKWYGFQLPKWFIEKKYK